MKVCIRIHMLHIRNAKFTYTNMESAPISLFVMDLERHNQGLAIPHIISSIVHRHADWSQTVRK
jgi:hypothetical protein